MTTERKRYPVTFEFMFGMHDDPNLPVFRFKKVGYSYYDEQTDELIELWVTHDYYIEYDKRGMVIV